jgi:ferredoxin
MAWISLAPTIEKKGEIHLSLAFLPNGDKVIHNGYEKWPIEVEKCTHQRIGNKRGVSCGVCFAVCPWNKPYTPFHCLIGVIGDPGFGPGPLGCQGSGEMHISAMLHEDVGKDDRDPSMITGRLT